MSTGILEYIKLKQLPEDWSELQFLVQFKWKKKKKKGQNETEEF